MAYMNQEKKKRIAAKLKEVVPADWKYSLGVRNHSTIVFTLRKAPVDLMGIINVESKYKREYANINHFYMERTFSGELLETLTKIKEVLNLDNYDNSDVQTDYFDVGHYVEINVGEFEKPMEVE